MTDRSGARPMPPAMNSKSLPFNSPSTGKPFPYGPRTAICRPTSIWCSQSVRQPHFLMENSMYRVTVGDVVIENIASPTPGIDSIAHWPGMCEKHTPSPVSARTTRKVLTSGVSRRMSVTTPIAGISASRVICASLPARG
ncbi:MAG: hypothetical protein BWY81_01005 [Firmicutes bacterium ADurb.Bin467]|nr:MAG: hypothetical protein BWY81_01005 [Firmicutes bacterium ADurb.Bin467]